METNFDLVLAPIMIATKEMDKRLRASIETDDTGIFAGKEQIGVVYPEFEIFAYNLVEVDLLAHEYQHRKVRESLVRYCAAQIRGLLNMDEATFYRVLDKRMEEYGRLVRENKRSSNPFEEGLEGNFIQNLSYAVFENKLFEWEGEVKPVPVLDAMKCWMMSLIFVASLLPANATMTVIIRNLFAKSPDITTLNRAELDDVHTQIDTELRELQDRGLL